MKKILAIFLVAFVCAGFGAAKFGFRKSRTDSMLQWQRVCKITIPYYAASTLSNIPVRFSTNATPASENDFPAEMLTTGGANACRSDGGDVRFTADAMGTIPCPSELEGTITFAASPPTGAKACWWARVPTINTADATVWVWYHNPAATMPAANDATWGAQAVWSNSYAAVYHLKEATNATVYDSTANANNSTAQTFTQAAGAIGGAADFSFYDKYISTGKNFVVGTGPFSVEQWLNLTDNATYHEPFSYGGSNVNFVIACYYNGHALSTWPWNDLWLISSFTLNTWHKVVITGNGGVAVNRILRMYLDGGLGASLTVNYNFTNATIMIGANQSAPNERWKGGIDETRISSIARSADWIAWEYTDQLGTSAKTVGTPGSP